MYYDLNKFPEGTNIEQRYVAVTDFLQDGGVIKSIDGSFPTQRSIAVFSIDFSRCEKISNLFSKADMFKVGDTVFGGTLLGTGEGKVLDLDLSSCVELKNLFGDGVSVVPFKLILRNLKPNILNELMYKQTYSEIELIDCDFSNTQITYFFDNSGKLFTKCSAIKVGANTKITNFFGNKCDGLTDFGGLIGLRASITSGGFNNAPNLSHQSLINILNGLYDFTGNGETPTSSQGKLTLGSTNLAKLSEDEKAIATDKGWVLS